MLWVDKHRPKKLSDLSYHERTTEQLEALAGCGGRCGDDDKEGSKEDTEQNPSSMPHLLFYGPTGSGKKTRIHCLLKALYGPGVDRLRLDQRTFTTPSKQTVDLNMITSNHHVEICPGDAGIYDRFVIQDVIKEMAANKNISANLMSASRTKTATKRTTTRRVVEYKVVVLSEVDQLSRQAQAALRRTMEKYSQTCRLILCCSNRSKVMEPVRSRCLCIRIAAPSIIEIASILQTVATKEGMALSEDVATAIAQDSDRNVRRALLMLQTTQMKQSSSSPSSSSWEVPKTDWEVYVQQLAAEITAEQSPQRLAAAREKLYELLLNCIPPSVILRTLTKHLLESLDDSLKHQVLEAATFYEHRITQGSKDIFHLEAFVAKYMAIYKKYLNDMFA